MALLLFAKLPKSESSAIFLSRFLRNLRCKELIIYIYIYFYFFFIFNLVKLDMSQNILIYHVSISNIFVNVLIYCVSILNTSLNILIHCIRPDASREVIYLIDTSHEVMYPRIWKSRNFYNFFQMIKKNWIFFSNNKKFRQYN